MAFCTDAPSLGSVAVMAAEQKLVAGWLSEPTEAQFWIRAPASTPSRSSTRAVAA